MDPFGYGNKITWEGVPWDNHYFLNNDQNLIFDVFWMSGLPPVFWCRDPFWGDWQNGSGTPIALMGSCVGASQQGVCSDKIVYFSIGAQKSLCARPKPDKINLDQ